MGFYTVFGGIKNNLKLMIMKKLIQRSTTRKQLLQNTINHFNSDNRAFEQETESCEYLTKDGKRCAVGRELPDKLAVKLDSKGVGVTVNCVFNALPKRLQNMGQDFLAHIQNLHDDPRCWTVRGLSEYGKSQVEEICRGYNIKGIKYPKHLT